MDRSDRRRRPTPGPESAASNVLAFPGSRPAASLGTYEIVKAGNVSVLRLTGARGMVQLSLTRDGWMDFAAQLVAATPRPPAPER